MKTELLARVSTEEQREAGNSLPAQVARNLKYIETAVSKTTGKKLVLDQQFVFDESAHTEHRKEFEKIIKYVETQKEVIALVADKVDRLTRDFLVGLPELERLRRAGKIELHLPSDNLVLHQNSPATDLFHFNIAVSLAQYYSDAISDNVKRGNETLRRKGIWTNKAPFGYVNIQTPNADGSISKTIVPHPIYSHLITEMFNLYASGGYSITTLYKEMIKRGLKNTSGSQISRSQIEKALKNFFYSGQAVTSYGMYPHKYDRLTTFEIQQRCIDILHGRKPKPTKLATEQQYIFQGLLTCQHCGCSMTPEMKTKKNGKQYIYYSCTNAKGICKREYVNENNLLKPIFGLLQRFSRITQDVQDQVMHELRKTTEQETIYHKAQITRIQTEISKIGGQKNRLLDAYITDNTSITKEMYDKKLQELSDNEQKYCIELEEHLTADTDYKTSAGIVISLARRAQELFQSSEVIEKRAMLRFLLQNPTVSAKNLNYTVRSPFNIVLELADCPSLLPDKDSVTNYVFSIFVASYSYSNTSSRPLFESLSETRQMQNPC